jgi:membrane-bound lytic murein transglycosylase MltF
VRAIASAPFTGDFDQTVTRRLIRVGVAANRTFYFVDKGMQRGAAYEMAQAFEDHSSPAPLRWLRIKAPIVIVDDRRSRWRSWPGSSA